MPPRHGVEVQGLREFRRELARVDGDLPNELADGNHQIAEMVVQRARGRAGQVSAGARKAAESLTAARSQRVAQVRLGGARHPFAAGYEFGSIRHPQFPAWRGSGPDAGYWLYPTIRESSEEIVETYGDLIDRLAAAAFPD